MNYAEIALPISIYPYLETFIYRVPDEMRESLQEGSLVSVKLRGKINWGVLFSFTNDISFDPKKAKNIEGTLLSGALLWPWQLDFIKYISQHYFFPMGLVLENFVPASVRKASENILLKEKEKTPESLSCRDSLFELNEEQKKAIQGIGESENKEHLLWGITGSGKTEVYLELVRRVLEKNGVALILVPEIALTPQLFERFEERFPGQVALFHSAQKKKKQREDWFHIRYGRKKIILGARSALFAPYEKIDLIILDEEHESSFKQEERLPYHALTLAREISRVHKAQLLCGSATPSFSILAEVETGRVEMHQLKNRAHKNALLPDLKIVNLKKINGEKSFEINQPEIQRGHSVETQSSFETKKGSFFSDELMDELRLLKKENSQGMLFLNRRGTSKRIICSQCSSAPNCPNCSVTLTPHRNSFLCHYCDYKIKSYEQCSECGEKEFIDVGIGTQGVVDEISLHLPELKILRLDRDSVSKKEDLEKILKSFAQHEADLLVGTQMVAKGHDFPNLSFVGVMLADSSLLVQDFQADEKTYQLLAQVAGRAGRADKRGRVLLQSFFPEHEVFQHLQSKEFMKSYYSFFKAENERRKFLKFPPHGKLSSFQLSSLDERAVQQVAQLLIGVIDRAAPEGVSGVGPHACPIYKVRNRYRYQILLSYQDSNENIEVFLTWLFKEWHEKKLESTYKTRLYFEREL